MRVGIKPIPYHLYEGLKGHELIGQRCTCCFGGILTLDKRKQNIFCVSKDRYVCGFSIEADEKFKYQKVFSDRDKRESEFRAKRKRNRTQPSEINRYLTAMMNDEDEYILDNDNPLLGLPEGDPMSHGQS